MHIPPNWTKQLQRIRRNCFSQLKKAGETLSRLARKSTKQRSQRAQEIQYLLLLVGREVEELPLIDVDDYVGVDLGMVHIAYDSDGIPYDDPGIEATSEIAGEL